MELGNVIFEEQYQEHLDKCAWAGVEQPTRGEFGDFLRFEHLLESNLFNREEVQQVKLREQIIENAFFPNGRWNGGTERS